MTLPITGPFSKTDKTFAATPGGRTLVREQSRTGYRQRKPYNLPLRYSYSDIHSSVATYDTRTPGSRASTGVVYSACWNRLSPVTISSISDAQNKAISRFSAHLGGNQEDSGLGVDWSQRREAVSMMTGRLISLLEFAVKLRARDFGGAAKALSMVPRDFKKAKLRNGAKFFGNNWLEFHFGWQPLVSDVYNAINILQMDIPHGIIKGSAKVSRSQTLHTTPPYTKRTSVYELNVKAKVGATIVVDNPNLFLANKLGLVNPALVAWDLVPFSFIVDWFVTTNDVLSSFSNTYGVSMSDGWSSVGWLSSINDVQVVSNPAYVKTVKGTVFSFDRSLGLPSPTLKVRPVKQLSVSRGLTAASLLAQHLKAS